MEILVYGVDWLLRSVGLTTGQETFDVASEDQLIVTICGGGNGAHIMAGLAASRPGIEVRVLTLYRDEAEQWTTAMAEGNFSVFIKGGGIRGENVELTADPFTVSKDPREVIPGTHIIIFTVPAYCHEDYFKAIEPYIGPVSTIIGLPGVNGFEFQLRGILKEKSDLCTVIDFETLPWVSRIREYGRAVDLLATRETIDGAVHLPRKPSAFHHNHLASFQYMLGDNPELEIKGHLLAVTLMAPNAIAQPTIMYGQWRDWEGVPVEESPLFFHGVSTATVELLSHVSEEVVSISREIMAQSPKTDLSSVKHIYNWYLATFQNDILDKTNLMTALKTNKAYDGLRHPCLKTAEGKYMPNFQHRYLREDIPFGMAVVKGIADIVGVETPSMDKVLYWAQQSLGKEFVVNGRLVGRDVRETRAPQRYGLTSLREILKENVTN
ncbi:tauropine dehydrogenase-like [Lineus longissimus]|uniref:tauropine dehydrogenase-like n=1 Tax=Lineus longissimus TaxID=88925 RepID=UPI002B4D464E